MSDLPEKTDPPAAANSDARWKFLRDVAVFEFKMFLDNVRDFFLMPASLVAALIDLVFKGEREGERFYKVLEWGRRSEAMINVYGELDENAEDDHGLNKDYSVDAVIARLEGVIVREYEKGGTAAAVKSAVDRAIDQLQREAGKHKDKVQDAAQRAADKLRETINRPGSEPPEA